MQIGSSIRWALLVAALLFAVRGAAEERWQSARQAMGPAELGADAWVDDARLVWIENDSHLDTQGRSKAWAYLFYSESLGAMRSWSVQEGKLQAPEDHSVRAEAPGLEPGWLDSTEIIRAVLEHVKARDGGAAELMSLVLVRGVFDQQPTWVAVFDTGDAPRLHIVLRARDGHFIRRWRG